MAKMRDRMDKLRKELEGQGINISDDALFVASYVSTKVSGQITSIVFWLAIGYVLGFLWP